MVMKRKAISRIAKETTSSKVDPVEAMSEENVEDEEEEMQIVAVEKATPAQLEKEAVEQRTKEVKSMSVADMKDLLSNLGLTTGKKEDMIKTLLKHEAKLRAEAREHEAKIRDVVLKKKEQLETTIVAELSQLCDKMGVKGLRGKQDRICALLRQWQEDDGVDKALAQMVLDARKQELDSMDTDALRKLCDKRGVDPFVKEVMVERISKLEREAGHYEKPVLEHKSEDTVTDKKVDMVEALLANESRRKQEKEARTKQEDAAANRMKELKAMAVDDLKSALTKKGVEPLGKKEELVEALFAIRAKEDVIMARKTELKCMGLQDMKTLLSSKGLESNKSKDAMVETMLKHEAKCREDLEAFNAKGKEVLVHKQGELATKTNAELKEMCASKNLALGGGKEERVERLLQEAQDAGEVDKAVVVIVRNTRKEALMAFDKPSLLQLCEATGADPFVKDVMVERLLAHESEEGECVEPAAKKSRKK